MAIDISWKSLKSQPQFTSPWCGSYNLFLAILQFLDIPRREDDLVLEEVCLGRNDPDEKISWERDCDEIYQPYVQIHAR